MVTVDVELWPEPMTAEEYRSAMRDSYDELPGAKAKGESYLQDLARQTVKQETDHERFLKKNNLTKKPKLMVWSKVLDPLVGQGEENKHTSHMWILIPEKSTVADESSTSNETTSVKHRSRVAGVARQTSKSSGFKSFSNEIQDLIWEQALSNGRIVGMNFKNYNWQLRGQGQSYHAEGKPPNLLHVCRRSRELALKKYKMIDFWSDNPFYFNTEVDSLYFSCTRAISYLPNRKSSDWITENVRHIIVGMMNCKQLHEPWFHEDFAALETLVVLHTSVNRWDFERTYPLAWPTKSNPDKWVVPRFLRKTDMYSLTRMKPGYLPKETCVKGCGCLKCIKAFLPKEKRAEAKKEYKRREKLWNGRDSEADNEEEGGRRKKRREVLEGCIVTRYGY